MIHQSLTLPEFCAILYMVLSVMKIIHGVKLSQLQGLVICRKPFAIVKVLRDQTLLLYKVPLIICSVSTPCENRARLMISLVIVN